MAVASRAVGLYSLLRPTKHLVRGSRCLTPQQLRARSGVAVAQPEEFSHVAGGAASTRDPEWDSARPFDEIPGPKPLPIIGNVLRFLPVIGELGEAGNLNIHYKLRDGYGDIVVLKGIPGRANLLFVFDADAIEKVFRNEGLWPTRIGLESMQAYRKLRPELFEGAYGLASTNGKEWADFRHAVNQTMMQPRNAKLYVGPIDKVTEDFIERMRLIRDENMEMPDNFANEMAKWALESITLIALDTRLGCLEKDLPPDSEPLKMIESVQTLFDCLYLLDVRPSLWKHISTPSWNRLVRVLDYFYAVVLRYIDQAMERLKTLPPGKVVERDLSVLESLLLKNDNPKIAATMAIDMMTAGIDTTSNTSTTALYFLAKNPEKQELLRQEVDRVLESPNTPITAAHLESMKYLRACIKESMRMEPIILGNARSTTKDMVIMGYQIPKGIIGVNSLICRQEKYFKRPDDFIPERWLPDKKYDDLRGTHPFAYMPFGFGPRMCVGRRFAQLEMETLLAKIIRNFRVEWHHPEPRREMWLVRALVSPLKFRMIDRV